MSGQHRDKELKGSGTGEDMQFETNGMNKRGLVGRENSSLFSKLKWNEEEKEEIKRFI